MRDVRKGNDIKVRWSLVVKGTSDPFNLSGLPLKLYLKNMYERKEVDDFSVDGNTILWTFFGKDQKQTGEHSLELVANEGVEGMMTTDICGLVNLVSCSCKVGDSTDGCGVETETIEVQSEVEFVSGTSIEVDTTLDPQSKNPIANSAVYRGIEDVKTLIPDMIIIGPLSKSGVLVDAFKEYNLAQKVGTPLSCLIKKEGFEQSYTNAILTVEKYDNVGYRLNFILLDAYSKAGNENDMEAIYTPDCVLGGGRNIAYIYNQDTGFVFPLGKGNIQIDLSKINVIGKESLDKTLFIDIDNLISHGDEFGSGFIWDIPVWENLLGISIEEYLAIVNDPSYSIKLKYKGYTVTAQCGEANQNMLLFDFTLNTSNACIMLLIVMDVNGGEKVLFDKLVPTQLFTTIDKEAIAELSEEKEDKTNKTTTLSSASTDTQYPSAKAVYDFLQSSKEVFEATHNVTTYEEIVVAYNKGRIVKCQYGDSVYLLNRVLANGVYFAAISGSYIFQIGCTNSNLWFTERIDNSHKLTVLEDNTVELIIRGVSAEVTTPQYVEDAIEDAVKLTAEEVASTEPTPAFPQVLYTEQELTEEQKSQARTNIGVDDAIESAIAELPEPESEVFKAIYGVTTYKEIKAAYDSGKVVHCDYRDYCYVLSRILSVAAYFDAMSAPNSFRITCDNNGWTNTTIQLERSTNRVTSLSDKSTNEQYPSAKAVYDFVQNSKDVFEAVYNKTTHEEIVAASNAGKVVYCNHQAKVYMLIQVASNVAYFAVTHGNYYYRLACYPGSTVWGETSNDFTHKLEVLNNGNVKVTISGKSQELMPATPSGDPMHYLYVSAGAEYNATDEDIEKQGMYGDTIVHKARHWYLNELGDITNDQMRAIFVHWQKIRVSSCYFAAPIRTNLPFVTNISNATSDNRDLLGSMCQQGLFETFDMRVKNTNYEARPEWNNIFIYCYSLKKLLGEIKAPTGHISQHVFFWIEEMRLKELKTNWSMGDSRNFSNASILFAINNEAATSAITITLHADAYARAMADSEITAALEAHPNVSLASA